MELARTKDISSSAATATVLLASSVGMKPTGKKSQLVSKDITCRVSAFFAPRLVQLGDIGSVYRMGRVLQVFSFFT